MMKVLKFGIQVIWAAAWVICGTAVGGFYGWENHGWLGAIVLGGIGLGAGALIASSPLLFLQLMH